MEQQSDKNLQSESDYKFDIPSKEFLLSLAEASRKKKIQTEISKIRSDMICASQDGKRYVFIENITDETISIVVPILNAQEFEVKSFRDIAGCAFIKIAW